MATINVRHRINYTTLDLDGNNREQTLAAVNEAFDKAEAEGHTDVRLSFQQQAYSDDYEYIFMGTRPESAEETILRERGEGIARMAQQKRDREQYERLKAQFES